MGANRKLLEPPPWNGSTMPCQDGKVAIVTGANSGIGFVTAQRLAEAGAVVILACRNAAKARAAEESITHHLMEKVPNGRGRVEFVHLDVGDLASVRRFAEIIQSRFVCIDLLINNAGVALPPQKRSAEGYEAHFAINHLGHFYLTTLLFNLLRASPAARIVHVGSLSHRWVKLGDLHDLANNTRWQWKRYGRSKLAQTLFMVELQRRIEAAGVSNVISLAAHPGVTYTELNDKVVESIYPKWLQKINKKIGSWLPLQRADMGALPTLYAATYPHLQGGAYIGPSGRGRRRGYPSHDELHERANDEGTAARLWMLSEQLTKTQFELL